MIKSEISTIKNIVDNKSYSTFRIKNDFCDALQIVLFIVQLMILINAISSYIKEKNNLKNKKDEIDDKEFDKSLTKIEAILIAKIIIAIFILLFVGIVGVLQRFGSP